ESKNYLEAAHIYTKLYESFGDQNYAKLALEIYFKFKRLDLAKTFLLKNPKIDARDEILLEVYRLQNDFPSSIKQAQLLYQNTQDLNYLAYYAMMSYENMQSFTLTKLTEIEKNLKTSASKLDEALYWNYLGYLMIEHDFKDSIRIQKGMEYVQLALDKEPQNTYYLDSLAWGYYKLKDCKKAKEIMDKIPQDEREKESEIKEHYKKITSCLRK
ncbi:tetratricopeptide repeat protein, partial [Helicobacter rodentium]